MPYRRLPNTDSARLKALKIAYKKAKEIPPFKLAFSQNAYQKVQSFLPGFEKQILEYKSGLSLQSSKSKEYLKEVKKAKLYISHFIQVMNMAIIRGDLAMNTRSFFELPENSSRVPNLTSESDLLKWGEILIKGEEQRRLKNLTPINNPTIAVVRVRYENFKDALNYQKTLQKTTALHLERLSAMRNTADDIILQVWNEVEQKFENDPEPLKREKATDYGITYVYRKNELPSSGLLDQVGLSVSE